VNAPSPSTWHGKSAIREQEVERLSDEFKRRISELQLAILSGKLSDEELRKAGDELKAMRIQLSEQLATATREETSRRVRPPEKKQIG